MKRLYVLSIDAMVGEDIEFMKTLPNLGPIVSRSSVVKDIVTVYPSLTYTVHASMMTGVYPDRHHVVNNEKFTPGGYPAPWYFDTKVFDKDVDNLISAAKRSGLTTACISWPVTGNIGADYLLPEVWDWDDVSPENMYKTMVSYGAKEDFLNEFWENYGTHLKGLESPYFHYLAHGATLAAIRNHQPEVIFEHLSMVDHNRHRHGVFASEVYKNAYFLIDLMFGATIDALKAAGVFEDTIIVITSDHGQTPINKIVALNLLFEKEGLLKTDGKGKLLSWKAYSSSAAHSAQIYLDDPKDEELKAKVRAILDRYQTEGVGIEKIYEKDELKERYHIEGDFSFMVEGEDGVSFSNKFLGDIYTLADNSDYKYSVATHGHEPEKGPKPAFIVSGPGVKQGVEVSGGKIVDEAPTIAALMGIELQSADGNAIKELLA